MATPSSVCAPTAPITRVGPYKIFDMIAQGACGAVYEARDTRNNQNLAVKLLRPEDSDVPNASTLARMFVNEGRLAGALRHRYIVRIYEAGVIDDIAYIAMEQVFNGRTLQRHCRSQEHQLSVFEAVSLIRKCAEGLQHAHELGVVHRDVKPRNILIDRGNEPRIADFGLAVALASDATFTHRLGVGSPLYMAPEQIRDEPASAQTDIFALTLLLYELLTIRHPFAGATVAEIQRNIVSHQARPPTELRPDIPRALDRIVAHGLAKSPAARYARALDLAADLDVVLDMLKSTDQESRFHRANEIARGLTFFDALEDKELSEVSRHARVVRFDRGQQLFAEGEFTADFHFIVRGAVQIFRKDSTLAEMGQGACVDESAAFSGRPRNSSAIALTRTLALVLSPEVFENVPLRVRAKLNDAFLKRLAGHLERSRR